jgi:hypothetical protein
MTSNKRNPFKKRREEILEQPPVPTEFFTPKKALTIPSEWEKEDESSPEEAHPPEGP